MIDNNHELTIGELDAVNGGFTGRSSPSVMGMIEPRTPIRRPEDPSPMFQQVLKQWTQGQG